jgi:hypothetical protein
MPHVVLYWQKISKTILEEAFFFICGVFGFCVEKFEKSPSERGHFF